MWGSHVGVCSHLEIILRVWSLSSGEKRTLMGEVSSLWWWSRQPPSPHGWRFLKKRTGWSSTLWSCWIMTELCCEPTESLSRLWAPVKTSGKCVGEQLQRWGVCTSICRCRWGTLGMERVAAWGAQICLCDTLEYSTHTHTHVTALILCALMLVMGVMSTGIIHTSHCEHTHTHRALYYLSTWQLLHKTSRADESWSSQISRIHLALTRFQWGRSTDCQLWWRLTLCSQLFHILLWFL